MYAERLMQFSGALPLLFLELTLLGLLLRVRYRHVSLRGFAAMERLARGGGRAPKYRRRIGW